MKLSKTSKMPCKSWSLEAVTHCPGSQAGNGELVDACKGCYARGGFYAMPAAKGLRLANAQDWQRAEWEDEMVAAIGTDPYFRWLDSGDLYHIDLAWKVARIIKLTPETLHWLPVRMGKFAKFGRVLRTIADMPNVALRHSSDSVNGETLDYGYGVSSTIVPTADTSIDAFICRAYERGGKCGDCRACWSKDVRVVAYPAHGRAMSRVIKLVVAA